MDPAVRELWLEDRQGVFDRRRDRAWWRCLHWCTSSGLLLAFVQWGWSASMLVAIVLAGMGILSALPCVGRVDAKELLDVLGWAALTALVAVGMAGLMALSLAVGLLVLIMLTFTAPVVRRAIRDLHTALRLSLVLSRELRARHPQ